MFGKYTTRNVIEATLLSHHNNILVQMFNMCYTVFINVMVLFSATAILKVKCTWRISYPYK